MGEKEREREKKNLRVRKTVNKPMILTADSITKQARRKYWFNTDHRPLLILTYHWVDYFHMTIQFIYLFSSSLYINLN